MLKNNHSLPMHVRHINVHNTNVDNISIILAQKCHIIHTASESQSRAPVQASDYALRVILYSRFYMLKNSHKNNILGHQNYRE